LLHDLANFESDTSLARGRCAHGIFDTRGVGIPEFGEFRHVEEFDILPEIAIAGLNWSVAEACLRNLTQIADGRLGRTLGANMPTQNIFDM